MKLVDVRGEKHLLSHGNSDDALLVCKISASMFKNNDPDPTISNIYHIYINTILIYLVIGRYQYVFKAFDISIIGAMHIIKL